MRVSEQDLAYAAGFLDGEGHFRIDPNRYAKPLVVAENSCESTVRWLQTMFGGTVRLVKKQKPHHRQLWRWTAAGNDAERVCRELAGYLKEKAPQALLILAVQQTKRRSPLPLSDEVVAERLRLAGIIKEHHHATP